MRETGIQLLWWRDVSWLIAFLRIITCNAQIFTKLFSGKKGLPFLKFVKETASTFSSKTRLLRER